MHWVGRFGCAELAELLMQRGLRADVVDWYGRTPLHMAAEKDNVGVASVFLATCSHTDFINKQDRDEKEYPWKTCGKTPLHYAAKSGKGQIVSLLLKYGACPEMPDARGAVPLEDAVESGNLEGLRILMQNCKNNFKCTSGQSLLHLAARNGHEEIVNFY